MKQSELSIATSREIERLYPFWIAMATKLTKSKDAASDLVHHVIARLPEVEALDSVTANGKLKYYLWTMMYREYISPDHTYFKLYKSHIPTLFMDENRADETWMGARLTNEQLDVVVNRLPPFNRVFLQAWLLSDKSPRKLAEEIGIDPNFANRNIKETKRLLRAYVIRE